MKSIFTDQTSITECIEFYRLALARPWAPMGTTALLQPSTLDSGSTVNSTNVRWWRCGMPYGAGDSERDMVKVRYPVTWQTAAKSHIADLWTISTLIQTPPARHTPPTV